MADINTIKCAECGHENESERIYCHNCGVKLDRSVLPAEKYEEKKETPAQVRKRVENATSPSNGRFKSGIVSLISTLIWAAIVAAIILMFLPPKDAQPVPKENELSASASDIPVLLENVMRTPGSKTIKISTKMINGYLKNVVRRKKGGTLSDYVKFRKIYVTLFDKTDQEPGKCRFNMIDTIFGYPFYIRSSYALKIENHRVATISMGGSIGRLPIHPLIMKYADIVFHPVWNTLQHEHKIMDKMQSITVQKSGIVLTTPADGRAL